MSKPYTDKEFELVRHKKVTWGSPEVFPNGLTKEEFGRLIATVDSLKWQVEDKKGTIMLQGRMLRERDDLKLDPEYISLRNKIKSLEEEIVKLKNNF